MSSIYTIYVTSVPYPVLISEIYKIDFLDLFFLDLILGLYATFPTVYWNAVEDCGKKSASLMKVAL